MALELGLGLQVLLQVLNASGSFEKQGRERWVLQSASLL